MRKNLIFILFPVIFAGGCATPEYQSKINSLEGQVEQLQNENTVLKDKVVALEDALSDAIKRQRVVLKAPTAKDIQIALKNAGFYQGDIDGKIGPKTKEAILKFQEANGLNPDGSVGSRTWEKLSGYLKEE
jgi:peptidoglycan hydrolase-like protein with peptidoglycan-binding domain